MALALHISWRYLFGKKGHNAINIVSGVSAAAVAVVTAAMICVLSVMNGFGTVISSMFSRLDPDLRIVAAEGKVFRSDTPVFDSIARLPQVAVFSRSLQETALVEFEGRQIPAVLKGVDSLYPRLTEVDSTIVDGRYMVYDGGFERAVMGQGLAVRLSLNAHLIKPVHVYAPSRTRKINLLRPDESFRRETCFMAGVFAVNQVQYDDRLMLVSLPLTQRLFEYEDAEVSAVELRLTPKARLKDMHRRIAAIVGPDFRVLDRYEQQADFFRILRIEKWLTTLLMIFILLIAGFNIVGSLSMLMLDKQEDIRILSHLGADERLIRRIFLFEGWLISALGAVVGIVLGVAVCLSQQYLGWLKLGNGAEYILSAYPVQVQTFDILLVAVVVLSLGWLAAWYPVRKLTLQKA